MSDEPKPWVDDNTRIQTISFDLASGVTGAIRELLESIGYTPSGEIQVPAGRVSVKATIVGYNGDDTAHLVASLPNRS